MCLEVGADPSTALTIMNKMTSNSPLGVADVPCPAPAGPGAPEVAGQGDAGEGSTEKPDKPGANDPKDKDRKPKPKPNPKKQKEKPAVARFNFICKAFQTKSFV